MRAIWRLLTRTKECPQCSGRGYRLITLRDRKIRQSCANCRKSGRVRR